MIRAFNLLDDPWLPVRMAGGEVASVGLRELFRRSQDILSLAETQPTSLVAQHRILLAIVHRALSAAMPDGWKNKDREQWHRDGLPVNAIMDYLDYWQDRFWLFHPEHPFMQVAALAEAEETRDKSKPWTQISLSSVSGNAPVVFDHACDLAPGEITPEMALSNLLGFLQFTPGGLVKTLRDSDKAGALANTAAVIPLGRNLAQTLVLNLHPAPARQSINDLPVWERKPLTVADLTGDPSPATGPNDRYTRLSRAVLLLRERGGGVRGVRFAAGQALVDDPGAPDPMACFKAGATGPVRLSFREDRALWRDLAALVPHSQNDGSQAAAVVQYALSLQDRMSAGHVHQPLLIAGLASEKAKLLRWRSERVELPMKLLCDADKVQHLLMLVASADTLFRSLNSLAINMLAEALPDSGSKDTRSRARSMLDASAFAMTYFSQAERQLGAVINLLAEGSAEEAESQWIGTLRRSANDAWQTMLTGMGMSPRALRAGAKYFSRFCRLVGSQFPKQTAATNDVEVHS